MAIITRVDVTDIGFAMHASTKHRLLPPHDSPSVRNSFSHRPAENCVGESTRCDTHDTEVFGP